MSKETIPTPKLNAQAKAFTPKPKTTVPQPTQSLETKSPAVLCFSLYFLDYWNSACNTSIS